jgi:two-component system response regulator YesN
MYRFLMVDDEEIVRRGFETKIDWRGSGFEFLPPCDNGRDAIAVIDRLLPDVVMTDIHMPYADGISVARHAMEAHPGIVVVVLSGYDEFQYAQAAIRSRVFDYVLKPVTSRDLSALLLKIKNKLDADRLSREESLALKDRADHFGELIRGRGLSSFISGASQAMPAEEARSLLGFDPEGLHCAAVVAEPDAREGGEAPLEPRLAAAAALARRSAHFVLDGGPGVCLVFEQSAQRCAACAGTVAQALLSGGPALRSGVGRAYPKWSDAPRSYAEARAALAFRLARGPQKPFLYVQAAETRESLALIRSREDRLCLGIRSGGRAAALALEYLEALGGEDVSPQRVRHEINSLFARIRDELAGMGVSPQTLSARLGADCYRLAEELDRHEAVLSAVERLSGVAAAELGQSGYRDSEWKVLDFKELVARHYMETDLSIGKAASRLSISESYLSKLVRRAFGASFVDYLAGYRVDRAKQLLASSSMRAYEVAEAVGYPDPRYFSSIFHKRCGLTPSEYRASLGAQAAGRDAPPGGAP